MTNENYINLINKVDSLEARIHQLYVKAELKRQGIGSALLEIVVKYVKEKGYKKISIHLGDEKYWESKLFYKAEGFVEIEPRMLVPFRSGNFLLYFVKHMIEEGILIPETLE